ncbi:hypothetical protein [Streptosporangium sp. CA-115845]|uniref:hypothetical protein n=1 Tax=Streptosporangium sp. CA-115845 TaxID=3240071 RepID=UPI003D94952F
MYFFRAPMRGDGEHPERVFRLPDAQGRHVDLRFDDFDAEVPESPNLLDDVLATEHAAVWSGVTVRHGISFADLHLWFAGFLPGFCKLAVDGGTELDQERGG